MLFEEQKGVAQQGLQSLSGAGDVARGCVQKHLGELVGLGGGQPEVRGHLGQTLLQGLSLGFYLVV